MSRASPKAGLSWAPGFRKKWQGRFFQAQEYLDRAVLELCEPYLPRDTGALIRSGRRLEPGRVGWTAPYAAAQYYRSWTSGGAGTSGGTVGSLRGSWWFHRMKADRLPELTEGVARRLRGQR